MTEKKWLIWSLEHDAWWRRNSQGYTHNLEAAGRYSYEEALQITAGANWGCGPVVNGERFTGRIQCGRPYEAMIREDAYGKCYKHPRAEIKP